MHAQSYRNSRVPAIREFFRVRNFQRGVLMRIIGFDPNMASGQKNIFIRKQPSLSPILHSTCRCMFVFGPQPAGHARRQPDSAGLRGRVCGPRGYALGRGIHKRLSLFIFQLLPSSSNIGFAQDTPARQNASRLAFALAYSYFGFAEDTSSQHSQAVLVSAFDFSYLCPPAGWALLFPARKYRMFNF